MTPITSEVFMQIQGKGWNHTSRNIRKPIYKGGGGKEEEKENCP